MKNKDKQIKELKRSRNDWRFWCILVSVSLLGLTIAYLLGLTYDQRSLETQLESCQEQVCSFEGYESMVKYIYNFGEVGEQNCFQISADITCEKGLEVEEYKGLGEKCIWRADMWDWHPFDYNYHQFDGNICLIDLHKNCEVIE